jgi:hypothetical protein
MELTCGYQYFRGLYYLHFLFCSKEIETAYVLKQTTKLNGVCNYKEFP